MPNGSERYGCCMGKYSAISAQLWRRSGPSWLIRAGSSLGGARPKAHVIGEDGHIAIAKSPSASTTPGT